MSLWQHRKYLIYALGYILAGTSIYIIFRNDVIFIDWLGYNKIEVINIGNSFLAKFVLYNLSDALWALSLMSYLSSQSYRPIRICGLILPIVMECVQLLKVCPGTFDIIDLTIYCIISTGFFIKWKQKKEL